MNSSANQKRENDPFRIAIKEDQITLAPENRATIQVGILNEGSSEEYVDIFVKGVPPEWVTIPTPVLHLASGEAKLVTITVESPVISDNRVGQYPLDVHVVSQNDPKRAAVARSTLTVAAYQSKGRIGVLLGAIDFAATPGTTIEIPVLLQNRGDQEDNFRLNVSGLPAHWVSGGATLTRLEPNTSAEVELTLQIPRSAQASAGRMPFTIQIASQIFPTQTTSVQCVLTIAAFSQFSASLEPGSLQAGQFGQVSVYNEGNTIDAYSLHFQSRADELIFEKAVQVPRPGPHGTQQMGIAYVEIPQGERFQVAAGERGTYSFRARLRSRPLLGNEETYPFGVQVRSTANELTELSGQVLERAYVPFWVLPVGVVGALLFCILFLIPLRGIPTSGTATQTAAAIQTQTASSGTGDLDGDGLTNEREAALGTDPLKADTDGDRLIDLEEVERYQTNPLVVDTDDDRLQDGDEIQIHLTDPRNRDMDN
ncbi:MAG TPA: hypothetical protein VJ830_02635, partial [Anaerolineales bacterium]|nr:hypothetical protein [Anaerolineales bacterium]